MLRRPMIVRCAAAALRLAAAPTFAAMALFVAAVESGPPGGICSAGSGGSWLGGMAPMYILMSVFSISHWLKFSVAQKAQ